MKYPRDLMNTLSSVISQLLKEEDEDLAFVLLVFDIRKHNITNYVSNSNKYEMIRALRETINRLEGITDNAENR